MYRWNNDYNCGAHPAILKALEETNTVSYCGYGLDEWCSKASDEIREVIGRPDAEVHFLLGGTQANYTMAAAALRPYQGVISAVTGHIFCHETGAVENTGHKILGLPGVNGKLTAEAIAAEAENYRVSGVQEHITEPKMVFLSFPSEFGTIYSLQELREIREVCTKYHMYLYIDGARLGYGLGSPACDVTVKDIAQLADAFYIGGTKCGALFGEAMVLLNDSVKDHFRSYIKQNGGMLAKGWLLGLQFSTLMQDGLYFDITRKAVEYAMEIKKAFEAQGIPFFYESFTNQQFVVLTEEQMAQIGKNHIFEYEENLGGGKHAVRFCTGWSTQPEAVKALIADIQKL